MKTRWVEIIIIVLALGLLSLCFAAWDSTKPADSDAIYTWPASIRANWDALETGGVNLTLSIQSADADETFADILTSGGIFFNGDNSTGVDTTYALIHSKMTNNRDGYEQGELWFGVLDNIASSGDYVTPIKINKIGDVIMGPALTPFGHNRHPASDYTNASDPSDEVTGTDALNYVCVLRNIADVTNRPITGANWESFWEQKGAAAIAWVDSTAYTPNRIFGERLGVIEGDNTDARPFAVRNIKASNISNTVGIGYSLLNGSEIERMAAITRVGFYDVTAGAEFAQYYLALTNSGEQIYGPYYRAESADSTSNYYSNTGPYGIRDFVVAKTGNYTVLYSDTKKIFTNQGAKSVITFTLPETRFIGTGFVARFKQGVLYLNGTESLVKWTDSPATAGEYYADLVADGDPSLSEPEALYLADLQAKGTLGSLANGEWDYGNQDTLGYNTIYFKHASGDPDGFSVGVLLATYRFRVARGNANEMFHVPGISGSSDSASIESNGRLGTGVDLVSFGNPVIGNAGYARRWQGAIMGYWKFTGATDGFVTLVSADTTPSVLNGKTFFTNATGVTITRFDDGYGGQEITLISKGATVYDTSTASRLIGSSVDITTASGDVTLWICETGGTTASVWRLKGFVDVSVDNSTGA